MSELPPDQQDALAMSQLVAGHDAALNDLIDRHGQRLFHYLLRLLQQDDEAADLAQETFVRVYQNRARFDPRHKFSTWLYTIATHLAHDRQRWKARRPNVSIDSGPPGSTSTLGAILPDPGSDPGEQLVKNERAAAVRSAIASLPENFRVPLVLAEYEDKSVAEIAEILECTPKAVENRLYRARQQLRTALEKLL
jgi:RNA polymerase sigma-70 factor (ECF subfamily)